MTLAFSFASRMYPGISLLLMDSAIACRSENPYP